jgi:flagellar protein FliS
MAFMNNELALSSYSETGNYDQVEQADGHELIMLLFDTLTLRIMQAKNSIETDDINGKIERVTKALNIIDGLRISLNHEDGGEIARNLDDLYDYMQRRLVEANAHNDVNALVEINSLVGEIKGAWAQIPVEARK